VGDYAVETLSNGGLGTRHAPSGKLVPHVLGKGPAEQIAQGLRVPNSPSPLMQASQAGAQAMQVANLGVGLLNLGVSAWTAWKVHKMDKKLDALTTTVTQVDQKLDSVADILEASVVHFDGLIRGNALMLGFLIDHQQHLGEGIARLRHELAQGVRSIHVALESADAQREARELEQQMRSLFRYYELCTRELKEGRQPPAADLRRIVDVASGLIAWLDTRLAAVPVGRPERLPLFVARAFALRLEVEARELRDEAATGRVLDSVELRAAIRAEVHALADNMPLMTLAAERSAVIEEYVFLHRALRGSATMLELEDGRTLTMFRQDHLSWDDGLSEVREWMTVPADRPAPQHIELETLEEHRGWRRLSGLPRGSSGDEVDTIDLVTALGLPSSAQRSEDNLRKMLRDGPDALERALDRINSEVDE
jgi:hypothetical protein